MGAVAVSRTSDCTDDDDESNALKILYDRLKCGEPSTADALLVLPTLYTLLAKPSASRH